MSRIYFHTPTDCSELNGPERHYMGMMCSRLMIAAFGAQVEEYHSHDNPLHNVMTNGYWSNQGDLRTTLSVGFPDGPKFIWGEELISPWYVSLDTALTIGSDTIKLLARIHSQCEVHGYVLGQNRKWLSDIMEKGVNEGTYRKNMGWESVIEMLRKREDEPVVMSYSVCDQFPNRFVAEWEDDCDGDGWYDLPGDKQWELAYAKLVKGVGLELKPEDWDDFRFVGVTAGQLMQKANEIAQVAKSKQ